MIQDTCIEVQTSLEPRPSLPPWFAEVVILSRFLSAQGAFQAMEEHVILVRKRAGHYEPLDFLAILIGYAISGERTLADFFQRIAPFQDAYMALFGRRCFPHRSSLSHFLSDVDAPALESLRLLFQQFSFAPGWTLDTLGGLFDRLEKRLLVFDVDATRQVARQRALPSDPTLPPARRRLDAVCAPGHKGRNRGEVVRTRTTVLHTHTHQWLGTFANAGNGLYRQELAQALEAIRVYLASFDLPLSQALVRLDGLYGDPIVLAQLIAAGVLFLTRGKRYEILTHPTLQQALAGPPAALMTSKTGCIFEVFEAGFLPLYPDGPIVRVIITRHVAPAETTRISVGKRIGEWVYELFFTTLPQEGYLPQDSVDLYYGRGAFECVLADEDIEQDPDRWCSYTAHGQELWQICSQWIWNLRLCLGTQMQAEPLRAIQWAPALTTPLTTTIACTDVTREKVYGPWQVAPPHSTPFPRFGSHEFLWHDDETLHCPAGKTLGKIAFLPEDHLGTQRRIYEAKQVECVACPLHVLCRGPKCTGKRGRTVRVERRMMVTESVTVSHRDVVMGPIGWQDIAARRVRRTWIAHWRGQQTEILPSGETSPPSVSPPARDPRAERSHERWSWQERRAYNRWQGPPRHRITVAGVPAFLASNQR